MIGRTLGNYRILEQVGMGGMATVYKAYDPDTDRHVAVKVLPEYYSQDPKFIERFRREAKAIAKLEHMNILPVHAYGEEDGIAYLVMRFMETGTLTDRLARGALPLDEAARLLSQIAGALDHAHRHGIIHRDVKPSNVLLDANGNAYLTDFGIAKIVEATVDLTGTGTALGTPQFMSPEQCMGTKELTPASDIYSLGVVLYQMVTGRVPYDAETPLAVIHMHLNEPLPPPRSIRPGLPEGVEKVILKAMAKQPEQRFESAVAMSEAFDRALTEAGDVQEEPEDLAALTTDMASVTPRDVSAPAERRGFNPLWIILPVVGVVLLGGLVVVLALAGLFFTGRRASTNATEAPLPTRPQPTATEAQVEAPTSVPTEAPGPTAAATVSIPAGVDFSPVWLLEGHADDVEAVAWSPDGTRLASASSDLSVIVWDVATGQQTQTLTGHTERVRDVAWSPDGTMLASGAEDDTVRVWDAGTGALLRTLAGHEDDVNGLGWSPDSSVLASASWDDSIIMWDPVAGTNLVALDPDSYGVHSVEWSPDNAIAVMDPLTGEIVHTLTGHDDTVTAAVWSPDGTRLASGSWDGTVRLWDAVMGDELALFGTHDDWVEDVAFSPDGTMLASGSIDQRVIVWDAATGGQLATLDGHFGGVSGVAWSPDGSLLATGSWDDTVIVWAVPQ